MGRIRSIKPEILLDEVTAKLPHLEWRLFVSMWLMADDYGNLRGSVGVVKGGALPETGDSPESIRAALEHLSSPGVDLLTLYTVRGQSYIHIRGWSKHQRVDKPGKPLCPPVSEADSNTSGIRGEFLGPRESQKAPRPDQDMDQEKEEDHDQERERPVSGKPDALPLFGQSDSPPAKPDPAEALAAIACETLNAALGTRYQPATAATLQLCKSLARAKRTPDEVRRVVVAKVAEWRDDAKMREHLCPATLLAASNFAKYLVKLDEGGMAAVAAAPQMAYGSRRALNPRTT